MAIPCLTVYSAAAGQPINGGRYLGRLSGAVQAADVLPAGAFGTQVSALGSNVGLADVVPGGGAAGFSTPAWVTAMSSTNTVYEVGGLPSNANSTFAWPSGGAVNALYTGTDSNYVYKHFGYGSAVFVDEIGANGAVVFGSGGEATFDEQQTIWDLSSDAPAWTMFQNPLFATSSAQAATYGASWYYSPTDYAALPGAKQCPRGAGEAAWAASWDKTFPIGYADWVATGKTTDTFLGNARPHAFRYHMPVYVPASMTGTGSGAILVNNRGWSGPFSQSTVPSGGVDGVDGDWFSPVYGSGRRQYAIHAQNVSTKAWSMVSPRIPDSTGWATPVLPAGFVDRANKRVYYLMTLGTGFGLSYLDLTAGLAGATWSGPTALTESPAGRSPYTGGSNTVYTQGHPTGRRLLFLQDANTTTAGMLMVDVDAGSLTLLQCSGLPSASTELWAFSYDPGNNRLIITTKGTFGVRMYQSPLPATPEVAGNWSWGMTSLALASGVALESGSQSTWQFGEGRSRYHPQLGVILMTQRFNKMLAYRPA